MLTEDGKEQEQSQEAQEQENKSSTIDWSTIDVTSIPEEVVRNSPAFKAVLTESIERRQELAKLRAADKQPVKATTEADKSSDESGDRLSKLEQALETLVGLTVADRQERVVEKVIATHKLPDSPRVRKMLQDEGSSENMEKLAAELVDIFGVKSETSKSSPITQTTSTGTPVAADNPAHSDLRKRIMDKLNDSGNILGEGIFNTGAQRQRGGGYN